MARKQKYINELEKQGFSLVPETTGRILDSIWVNDEKQVLIIKFATGGQLIYKPEELSGEFRSSESDFTTNGGMAS